MTGAILLTRSENPVSKFVRVFSGDVSHVLKLIWSEEFRMWFVFESHGLRHGVRFLSFVDWLQENNNSEIFYRPLLQPLDKIQEQAIRSFPKGFILRGYNDLVELAQKGLVRKFSDKLNWLRKVLGINVQVQNDNQDLDCSELVTRIDELLGLHTVNNPSAIMPGHFLPGGEFDTVYGNMKKLTTEDIQKLCDGEIL